MACAEKIFPSRSVEPHWGPFRCADPALTQWPCRARPYAEPAPIDACARAEDDFSSNTDGSEVQSWAMGETLDQARRELFALTRYWAAAKPAPEAAKRLRSRAP